ncbi:fungal hydrophobin [Fistulina hepatica ATCC 64428]|nr:fungal hydrophobin [Fistulina hepatica ATCC 64428]
MQFKLSALATVVLATLAVATPTPRGGGGQSCSSGPVQCCNSVQDASSPAASSLLGLLGVIVGADVPIGLTCNPITVIGAGGTSCNAQTVCCDNNNFNGVVAIGCTPINLNL